MPGSPPLAWLPFVIARSPSTTLPMLAQSSHGLAVTALGVMRQLLAVPRDLLRGGDAHPRHDAAFSAPRGREGTGWIATVANQSSALSRVKLLFGLLELGRSALSCGAGGPSRLPLGEEVRGCAW